MEADHPYLTIVYNNEPVLSEEREEFMKAFDAYVWLYMRTLRARLRSDKQLIAFLEEVGPDIILHYGRARLIAMSWACDRPDAAQIIAKR